MTRKEWDSLLDNGAVTDIYREKYFKFMYDSKNIGNCKECPENLRLGRNADADGRECGQQNCWVVLTCNKNNR